jgi:multimeric flavodoxin WrbA
MRFIAINGSPQGGQGNTDVLVRAFLDGASAAGAETGTVYLSERKIANCQGCHSCWSATPGRCVVRDDMAAVLGGMAGAGVIVLASPVYLANVSGMLKGFIDRLTVTGSPHAAAVPRPAPPLFVMASTCGFPGAGQFDVISLWVNRLAAMMGTRVAAEIYAAGGRSLRAPSAEQQPAVDACLSRVQAAGSALARGEELGAQELAALRAGLTSPGPG